MGLAVENFVSVEAKEISRLQRIRCDVSENVPDNESSGCFDIPVSPEGIWGYG
jgi:hypothetical protein